MSLQFRFCVYIHQVEDRNRIISVDSGANTEYKYRDKITKTELSKEPPKKERIETRQFRRPRGTLVKRIQNKVSISYARVYVCIGVYVYVFFCFVLYDTLVYMIHIRGRLPIYVCGYLQRLILTCPIRVDHTDFFKWMLKLFNSKVYVRDKMKRCPTR